MGISESLILIYRERLMLSVIGYEPFMMEAVTAPEIAVERYRIRHIPFSQVCPSNLYIIFNLQNGG